MITPYPSIASLGDRPGAASSQHAMRAFTRLANGPGVLRHDDFIQAILREPHPLGNFAAIYRTDDASAVARNIADLEGLAPAAFLFGDVPTDEIVQMLAAAGFTDVSMAPSMAVEIDQLRPTKIADGYEFRRVITPPDRDEWIAAATAAFPIPRAVSALFAGDINELDPSPDAPLQFFYARKDGVPVATSMVAMLDGLAGIYAVSTHVDHRGQGLGGHLTAEPLRIAARCGYRVGVLQASAAGHPVYLRLGFTDQGAIPRYIRRAAEPVLQIPAPQ